MSVFAGLTPEDITNELDGFQGFELPSAAAAIYPNVQGNLHISLDSGEEVLVGITVLAGTVESVESVAVADPDVDVYLNEQTLLDLLYAEDGLTFITDALASDLITYEAHGLWNSIRFGTMSVLTALAGFFV